MKQPVIRYTVVNDVVCCEVFDEDGNGDLHRWFGYGATPFEALQDAMWHSMYSVEAQAVQFDEGEPLDMDFDLLATAGAES